MIKKIPNLGLHVPFVALLCLMLSLVNAYGQQTECGVLKIDEARRQYATGHFNEVIALLTPCLNNGFSDEEKVQAYKILAVTKIATDSLDQATSYTSSLLEINSTYEPEIFDPPRFVRLLNSLKQRTQGVRVSSVSKKDENVLTAPATVSVVTDDDMMKRGYTDVEQVFHDLSGFDISLGRSANYSNLYQRGYRSASTDRTLLLVDGIEQNDLVSNNAIISRQYPMSNIKRVEVIYGPASTMYGPNAYVGVINIVTKSNYEMLGEGKNFGINVHADYATYNTKNIDATLTARNKDVSISIAGRYYDSNELDINSASGYSFNYGNANYAKALNITDSASASKYITAHKLTANPYYTIGANNKSLSLTAAGLAAAKAADQSILGSGYGPGVDNFNKAWYVRAKIQATGGFTFGVETFRTNESLAEWYYTSGSAASYVFTNDPTANRWVTWNTNLFFNYDKRLGNNLNFTNITSYRVDAINGATNFQNYKGYYNGVDSIAGLVNGLTPTLVKTYYYRTSNQLEDELKFIWSPIKALDVVSGFDFRSSLIQIDYAKSNVPYPEETGTISTSGILGSNYFRTINSGLYSQGTYHYNKTLNLIGGARFDNNHIRQNGGYGTVFNYRLGAVYTPGQFIFKAIYATAFEAPSGLQLYGTITGRELAAPGLQPEHVKNLDLSMTWVHKDFQATVVAYDSYYQDVIVTATNVPLASGKTTSQFQNGGKQHITGLQIDAKYNIKNYTVWGNGTLTNPIDEANQLRISDIASFNANLGVTGTYFKKLQATFTTNYTGVRKAGAGTSGAPLNPITSFPAVDINSLNLSYRDLFKGGTIQFKVLNMFDKQYSDPGVRDASTTTYNPALPQQGRTFDLKVIYNL